MRKMRKMGAHILSKCTRWVHFFDFETSLYYRKRGSASYIVREVHSVRERERERDTEKDGSDVTIVALNWRWIYTFPLPKIRTIGHEFTLSLAKNSHFSFLPSHFPSLPSLRGHHCGAEIRNGFTLSVAKKFFALFVPTLSNGASRATSDRKPKTNDQILPSPILFFPSKKWIKSIPKTIGNRKRDCAWGGSGWETLPEKICRSQSTNQEGVRSVQRTDLCFAICRFSQVRFLTPSHLTHNLFFYFQ